MCQHCAHEEEGWSDLLKYDTTYSTPVGLDGDSDSDGEDEDSDHDDGDSDSDSDSDAYQSVRATSA